MTSLRSPFSKELAGALAAIPDHTVQVLSEAYLEGSTFVEFMIDGLKVSGNDTPRGELGIVVESEDGACAEVSFLYAFFQRPNSPELFLELLHSMVNESAQINWLAQHFEEVWMLMCDPKMHAKRLNYLETQEKVRQDISASRRKRMREGTFKFGEHLRPKSRR
jgi:hypothetical protein